MEKKTSIYVILCYAAFSRNATAVQNFLCNICFIAFNVVVIFERQILYLADYMNATFNNI
jgi:hypothetical protein